MKLHAFNAKRFVTITLLSGLFLAFLFFWLVYFPEGYHSIATEDGPIENLSALLFFLAFIGFLVAAKRSDVLKVKNSKLAYTSIFLWAALALFSAGEEISWGQRIFGTDLPDSMKVKTFGQSEGMFTNVQNETNFHNLGFVTDTVGTWRLTLIAALGTSIILPLMTLNSAMRRFFSRLSFPVPPFDFWLLGIGSYVFLKYAIPYAHLPNNAAETSEMTLGLIFFSFALFAAIRPNDVFVKLE